MICKIWSISILTVLTAQMAIAQSKQITRSNLTYDVSGRRIIYDYDLNAKIPCKVLVTVEYKGVVVENPTLRGDEGDCIKGGTGKKIIWYCNQDIQDWSGAREDVVVKVRTQLPDRKIGELIGGITLISAGAGILVPGMQNISVALDDYAVYRDNTNPYASVWANQPRSEYYSATNSKYKSAQYLLVAGSAALGTGAALLLNRAIYMKKSNWRKCHSEFAFSFQPGTGEGNNLGMVIKF